MLLALDLGNTNLKCGLFSGSRLVHTLRAETRRERTADEHSILLRDLLALADVAATDIDSAIIVSVVPALTPVLVAAIQRIFACTPLVIGRGSDADMPMRVDNPSEVGADRVINAIAARNLALSEAGETRFDARLARGIIVVDLGTATKLDCVSPSGEFLGGVIAPGVQIGLEALASRGAKLPHAPLAAPPAAIGRNTIHCIQSGVVYGHAALVDGLVARFRSELAFEADVLGTGGLAAFVAPHTETLRRIEPELTLRGLCALHMRKSKTAEPSA
jgi:type III pantothenate kinase